MLQARHLGLPLVLLGAACVRSPESQAPKPLKPQDGPKASISVDYMGGLLNRSLHAYFRSEQGAYVVVGHLGGDGRIRILYPESPDESGYIRGKRMYRTTSATAHYDGVPSLFSFAVAPHRAVSALFDSYDGRGHGYVFIVASQRPLRYGLLDDYAGWAEWEVEDYHRSFDPRYAVRSFADMLAGGANYTLRFATSGISSAHTSYASRAWDCTLLSTLSLMGHGAWSGWNSHIFGLRFSPQRYCAGTGFFPSYAYSTGRAFGPVVVPEPGSPAPTLDRPGRRGFGNRTEIPTRSTLTRVSANGTTGGNRWDRDDARRVSPRSTPRTRAEESARTAERRAADRDRAIAGSRGSTPRSDGPGGGAASGRTSSPSSGTSGTSSSSGSSRGSSPAASPRDERKRPDSR